MIPGTNTPGVRGWVLEVNENCPATSTLSFQPHIRKALPHLPELDHHGLNSRIARFFLHAGNTSLSIPPSEQSWRDVLTAPQGGLARSNDLIDSCLAKLCFEAKRARICSLHHLKTDFVRR